MPKIVETGYKKKVYHAVFEHKKNSKFIVMWEFTENEEGYVFKAICKPYVNKKGEQHVGLDYGANEEDKPS